VVNERESEDVDERVSYGRRRGKPDRFLSPLSIGRVIRSYRPVRASESGERGSDKGIFADGLSRCRSKRLSRTC